jgi:hypothetical protein
LLQQERVIRPSTQTVTFTEQRWLNDWHECPQRVLAPKLQMRAIRHRFCPDIFSRKQKIAPNRAERS